MHEISLVEGILDTVKESAIIHGITTVSSIKLVIGKMTMALPSSLDFAFDCLKQQDELFKSAVLVIEERDIIGQCGQCQQEFLVDEAVNLCPVCKQPGGWNLISGRELYIESFEGES